MEFALECVLGIENAVEEHDEPDPDEGESFDFQNEFCYCDPKGFNILSLTFIRSLKNSTFLRVPIIDRSEDVTAPPPKA